MNFKEEINERQKINRILVQELSNLVEAHPTQRFGQILINYFFGRYSSLESLSFREIIYNEEPAKTLGNLGKN